MRTFLSDSLFHDLHTTDLIRLYAFFEQRFYVKAAGEWAGKSTSLGSSQPASNGLSTSAEASIGAQPTIVAGSLPKLPPSTSSGRKDLPWNLVDIEAYRPKVVADEWFLSEIDLQWIADGACEFLPQSLSLDTPFLRPRLLHAPEARD